MIAYETKRIEHWYWIELYNGKVVGPLNSIEAGKLDNRYGKGYCNNFHDRIPKVGDVVKIGIDAFPCAPWHNGIVVTIIAVKDNFYWVKGVHKDTEFWIREEDIQWWYN